MTTDELQRLATMERKLGIESPAEHEERTRHETYNRLARVFKIDDRDPAQQLWLQSVTAGVLEDTNGV